MLFIEETTKARRFLTATYNIKYGNHEIKASASRDNPWFRAEIYLDRDHNLFDEAVKEIECWLLAEYYGIADQLREQQIEAQQ